MHCMKSVSIQSSSRPYFSAFGLNMDQNNSKYRHFLRSDLPYSSSSKISIVYDVRAINSEWLKGYLSYMSKEKQSAWNCQFFFNLCQVTNIFVTKFVPRRFWWIVYSGFNGMKHIFNQGDPHVDYTICFCC